jgi:hypothetical protein
MLGCATGIGTSLAGVVAVTVTPVLISDPAMAPDPDGPCRIAPARAAAVMAALPPMTAKGLMLLVLTVRISLPLLNSPIGCSAFLGHIYSVPAESIGCQAG